MAVQNNLKYILSQYISINANYKNFISYRFHSRKLLSNENQKNIIKDTITNRLHGKIEPFDFIVPVMSGGHDIAKIISKIFHVEIRRIEDLEKIIQSKEVSPFKIKIALIDTLINSGGSIYQYVLKLHEININPKMIFVIIFNDYENNICDLKEKLKIKSSCKFTYLYKISEIEKFNEGFLEK